MQVKAYKLFTQMVGNLLLIAGLIDVAWSWPPGDIMGWLFMLLGATALWVGRSSQQ